MESFLSGALKDGLKVGVSVAVKAVIASAVTALPLLGIPGVNAAFVWVVNWVAGELLSALEEWLAETIIDVQVKAENKAYAQAREELKAVLASHVQNPKEIENASDEFDRRIADLIRLRH